MSCNMPPCLKSSNAGYSTNRLGANRVVKGYLVLDAAFHLCYNIDWHFLIFLCYVF